MIGVQDRIGGYRKGTLRMRQKRYSDNLDLHPIFHVLDLEALGSSGSSLVIRPSGMKQSLHFSPRVVKQIVNYSLRHFFVGLPWCLRVIATIVAKEK